jgi:HEPN domain-containing protein
MQPHEELLFLSDDDLNAAKDLLVTKRYNSGIYHTQQAAEKAFKAYLSYQHQALINA